MIFIKYEKNLFKKLKVKNILLVCCKKVISINTISPLFQEKIILSGNDILRFFKIKNYNSFINSGFNS